MTPKPRVMPQAEEGEDLSGDLIAISGMAGLYPSAHHVNKLSQILYNKVNPIVKSTRWVSKHPEVSQYGGCIPDVECFDAQFFKVHYRLCNLIDPMSRKMLEQSYQAIFDAGCNPESLSGKKVGVFIGNCLSESEKACLLGTGSKSGLGITGCSRSMFANRISYYLNLKGPSVSIDESCCSSSAALEMAYDAIGRGECEAAIVGGVNLCLQPQTSVHYGRAINTCKDGKTKSFDANADGCSWSEAINIIFLQKAKDAFRIYAFVVHAKCEFLALPECETGAKYGFYRNPRDLVRFLETFYEEAKVSPNEVQYIEAFGAATQETDKLELDVVDEVFCKDRSKPLKVGSVMSNIGYVGGASGNSAITKVLLGYHYSKLAANLHYETPRDDIAAIREGRIEVLTEHKELIPTYYTAVNGLSICGSFSHVLLRGFNKKKDINKYKSSFARIVLCSGRQESSVAKIIDDLKSRPIDAEEHALLHQFYERNVTGHLGRGYVILDTNENMDTVLVSSECDYIDQGRRPLWFVYSGMGSQWPAMGKDLMRIPVFAAAIQRCHRVLEPKGLDIVDIITSDDPKTFDNIIHSFVGITAVQIGLTDVLRAMDIVPDMIIGHSVGEIGCAYADDCFTAEEAILCAYSRGLVSVQTPFIRGSMAAIGLGYKEMLKLCPPEIEVACHNSASSSTISGPAGVMAEFVNGLTGQGIFAKEVPCSNIAYHSRYIADAGPTLMKYLKEVIPDPRPRSSRWLSTSVPQGQWDEPEAKYCSAEYFTNNLLSPVLFEETSQHIPPNAVLIEVAPHGLLQAILKRSLPQSCKLLPLARRGYPKNSTLLLEAVGRLYMEGFLPKVKALYPKVEFPVSNSTPMLSHLVDWVYQEKWSMPIPTAAVKRTATESWTIVSTYDAEHSYLKGHVIRGKNHYPFCAALVLVWDTLAMSLNLPPKHRSVQFDNVYFHSQPILHKKNQIRINVAIHKGAGKFEVLNEKSIMIKGTITANIENEKELQCSKTKEFSIDSEDIYRLLYAKGYQYNENFRSIDNVNESLTEARIVWKDNWTTFLDGIIQLNVLRRKHHAISKLNYIRKMVINVNKHYASLVKEDDKNLIIANLSELRDTTICGGVTIESPKFFDLSLGSEQIIALGLGALTAVPLFTNGIFGENEVLYALMQIVADNIKNEIVNVVEIINVPSNLSGFNDFETIIHSVPGVRANYTKLKSISEANEQELKNANLIMVANVSNNDEISQLIHSIPQNSFVIYKGKSTSAQTLPYRVISSHGVGQAKIELIKKCNQTAYSKLKIRPSKEGPSCGEYYLPLEDTIDPERGAKLQIGQIGDFDSLHWVEAEKNNAPSTVMVHFAGVNIVFVNKLLGIQRAVNEEINKSIIDFSGITRSGVRVMGLLRSSSLSSQVSAPPDLLLPVPSHWTMEEAATVPLSYTLAFYILFIKASIVKTSTILIQGGAGTLGQALISTALAHGCEVFTTVSSNAKKLFVQKLFPELKDENIIKHSRDLRFVGSVLYATNGRGCDVVISQAKGQLKNFSLQCLASNGVLVDTTVINSQEDYYFGMNYLTRDRSYLPIDMTSIFNSKYYEDLNYIRTLIVDGIRCGYVRPLSRVVYRPEDVAKAFRLQATCHNRGRVLLDLRSIMTSTLPRFSCSSSSWQLLVSDHEVLILKIAEKLVQHGAKKLILAVANVTKCSHVKSRIWKNEGVKVEITATTLNNINLDKLKGYQKEGPLENVLIVTNKSLANIINGVNNLASLISKSCATFKRFALITFGNIDNDLTNKQISDDEIEISDKISVLKLPEINLSNEEYVSLEKKGISINDVVDVVEKALCSQQKTIVANILCSTPRKTLLEQLLKIADLKPEKIPNKPSLDTSLNMLNIDTSKLSAIQSYLRDVYDVCLKINEIKQLTIQSINNLEEQCVEFDFMKDQGLGIGCYFPKYHTDELVSTTDVMFLRTLSFAAMYDNDVNAEETQLCIVPGLEGHHSRLATLCERLKIPALVLQPGVDLPNETIPDQALRYVQTLTKMSAAKNNFYLLGYEVGVLVALEMAHVLEKAGLTGTVFCVGGSPAEVIAHFKTNLRCYESDEELQMGVLKHAFSLISNESPDILDPLRKHLEWRVKLDMFLDKMRGNIPGSIQYTKRWIEYMYAKLSAVLQMQSTPRVRQLRSQIVSLRPQYDAGVDTSIGNYSSEEVITYQLEAPLSLAVQDLMCAAIVNRHLDDEIQKKINNRNICQTYVCDFSPLIVSS